MKKIDSSKLLSFLVASPTLFIAYGFAVSFVNTTGVDKVWYAELIRFLGLVIILIVVLNFLISPFLIFINMRSDDPSRKVKAKNSLYVYLTFICLVAALYYILTLRIRRARQYSENSYVTEQSSDENNKELEQNHENINL